MTTPNDSTTPVIGVAVRCMEARHTEKLAVALKAALGYEASKYYELTGPGGAGLLLNLFEPERKKFLLDDIGVCANNLHATEVYLLVHGSCDDDCHGCGGYILKGYKEKFDSPETSKTFMSGELAKAAAVVNERFPQLKVRTFYVTFAKDGTNLIEEISADKVVA